MCSAKCQELCIYYDCVKSSILLTSRERGYSFAAESTVVARSTVKFMEFKSTNLHHKRFDGGLIDFPKPVTSRLVQNRSNKKMHFIPFIFL